MVSLIGDFARIVGFADQPCDKCGTVRPLYELVALVDVGVLVGWVCRKDCQCEV